jgi:hypothetical protein
MFQASLIIQAFGNDTTTGYSFPFTSTVFTGLPFGFRCNTITPTHFRSTKTFTKHLPYSTNTVWYLTIPTYGGQSPCSLAKRQAGAPLTGTGNASTMGTTTLRTFTLPRSAIAQSTSGSFSYYYPSIFRLTYANLKNQTGSFFAGAGPGNFSLAFTSYGAKAGRVVNKAGPNQFGGAMPLLGKLYSIRGYFSFGLSVGRRTWLLYNLGRSAWTYGGFVTGGFTTTATNMHYGTLTGAPYTTTVGVSAFPWTTGTVSVTATRGYFPTVLQRKGYDSRTSLGAGTIQMVTPMLTRWKSPGTQYEKGAIGILRIVFTPEPSGWLLLVAGLGVLVVLHRVTRRS